MWRNALVLGTALVLFVILVLPRVRNSRAWKATVTPLASIMGSGFLVSAPLVAAEVGVWAPAAMAGLLAVAFGLGSVLRALIRLSRTAPDDGSRANEHHKHRCHRHDARTHRHDSQHGLVRGLESISQLTLAGAYVVSVSYYLQLLAAFVLDQFDAADPTASRAFSSAVLLGLTLVGAGWGLRALERIETFAVSLNLSTIGALLLALAIHDAGLFAAGNLALPDLEADPDPWHAGRVLMGLLIVVQGFETSRFLGAEHPPEERARTMRTAQLVASAIYLAFVALLLPLLGTDLDADVTAIVGLVAPVASILPIAIVVAAVCSQFSAAVADDAGCAGLLDTVTGERISPRLAYALIGGASIALTWLTDVMSVISVASRAFALFYALQCAVAVATAARRRDVPHRRGLIALATVMGLLALAVTVFGLPAE